MVRGAGCRIESSAVLTVLLVVLPACGGTEERAPGAATTRDSVRGRLVVRSPGEPALERGAVELTREWSRSAGQHLGRIRSWEPEPELRAVAGRIVVSDPVRDRLVFRRGSDGERVLVLPERGRRSVEFDSLHALAGADSIVAVADGRTIRVFDPGGRSVDERSVSGFIVNLYATSRGSLLVRTREALELGWLQLTPGAEEKERRLPSLTGRSVVWPEARQDGCWMRDAAAESIVAASCTYATILELGLDGEVRREFALELPPVESSEEELRAVERNVARQVQEGGREVTPRVLEAMQKREAGRHRLKKRFRAVRRDPTTGRLAVLQQTPDYMGGGAGTLRLFGSEGRYLAAKDLERQWIDFDFADGSIYALVVGSSGERVRVAAYELRTAEDEIAIR